MDWVLVELRDAATPAEAVTGLNLTGWPKAFFLKSDGSVVGLDGTSQPGLGSPVITKGLFVVIRHRNHLPVLSASGAVLAGEVYSWDFTTGLAQAYGGASGYKMSGTKAVMVAGDMENLAYLPSVFPSGNYSLSTPYYHVYGYEGNSVSAAKSTANFNTYGVLYNWAAAMNGASGSTSVPSGVQGICPPGWHLPSDAEWTILTDYLTNNGYGFGGSGDDIGQSMASASGWATYSTEGTIGNNQAANNSSGFAALPGGYLYIASFFDLLNYAYFWSSSESSSTDSGYFYLYYNRDGAYRDVSIRYFGFSVRCLKN